MCVRFINGFRFLSGLAVFAVAMLCAGAGEKASSWVWTERSSRAGGGKGAVQLSNGDILATRTAWTSNGTQAVCARSRDGGGTWKDVSVIAAEKTPGADVGDGHLLALPDGSVLFSYRHNLTRTNAAGLRRYSIRVAVSRDGGGTWLPHSVVAESSHDPRQEPEALRGLWSSFLLLRRDGVLMCCYDDEDTPHRNGFFRHQWLTLKTWNTNTLRWEKPVTVARAHDRKHLSRDGMPGLAEFPDGRLVCVFESVQTAPPHANCLRMTESRDGGATWSWRKRERKMVYAPAKTNHMALSPWTVRLPDNRLVCLFATDEDRDAPGKSGTPPWQLQLDIKAVVSPDGGRTWRKNASVVDAQAHRAYMPGVLLLKDGSLLATWKDYASGYYRAAACRPAD